jgi:3'-5' exoribonuclease
MAAASKQATVALCEMRSGQQGDFFALLAEKSRRTTRDGKPFYSLRFRDAARSVTTPVWENSPHFPLCETLKTGLIYKIRGVYTEHEKFGGQIDVHAIRLATDKDRADGYDPDAFVCKSRFDVDAMMQELVQHAESIDDDGLRDVVLYLLKTNEEAFRKHPAAGQNHHAYQSGLLEHTLSVVRTGAYLADKYREYYPDLDPPLNRDLIVAGCILHDIGKLVELTPGADVNAYTTPGMLVGHILIGRDMLREAAKAAGPVDPELLLYLEHVILSHQGTPEWGSPKVPMIPEALLVHFADDVDAKMAMFVEAIESHEGDEDFTPRSFALERKVLRKRNK